VFVDKENAYNNNKSKDGVILIIGASSRLGQSVTKKLLLAGRQLRLMTRYPQKIPFANSTTIQIVKGDLRDHASLETACVGVEQILLAAHSFMGIGFNSPQKIDQIGNISIIDIAKKCGVRHIVFTSIYGVCENHPVDVFRIKFNIELYLKSSGIEYTILRPSAFMETWTSLLNKTINKIRIAIIVGKGENPINFVSVEDVSEITTMALNKNSANQIIEIGGPENLTLNQVANLLELAKNQSVTRWHIPIKAIKLFAFLVSWILPAFAKRIKSLAIYMDSYDQTYIFDRQNLTPRKNFKDVIQSTIYDKKEKQ
jgi:NADH dehydrogenase